jgi:hypothetical protein
VGLVVFTPTYHRQLVGDITAVEETAVEIALADPRHQSELVPGMLVFLRTTAHRPEIAQVLAVTGGWEPLVVVRPLGPIMPPEHRAHLRHLLVQPLDLLATVLTEGRVSAFRIRVIDLSDGGAGLFLTRPLAPGDRLRVRLTGEEAPPGMRDFAGKVVWVQQFQRYWRAGVRFDALTPHQEALLQGAARANEERWSQMLELAAEHG